MRSKFLGIFVVAAVGLSPYAAYAKNITLSGTHSQSQVRNDCAGIGGSGGSFTTHANPTPTALAGMWPGRRSRLT